MAEGCIGRTVSTFTFLPESEMEILNLKTESSDSSQQDIDKDPKADMTWYVMVTEEATPIPAVHRNSDGPL